MKIWSKSEAKEWNEYYPIGNGRLGAMISGNIEDEKIVLNEDSLWSAPRWNRGNPDARKNRETIIQYMMDDRIKDAERLIQRSMFSCPIKQSNYEVLGTLHLQHFEDSEVLQYERYLDLDTACFHKQVTLKDYSYHMECFASYPQQAIFISYESSKPIDMDIYFKRENDKLIHNESVSENSVMMQGVSCGENGIHFSGCARVYAKDGKISTMGHRILIEQSTTFLIVVAAATKNRFEDDANTVQTLCTIDANQYEFIKKEHIQDYQQYFHRTQFHIVHENLDHIPIDERLQRVKEGKQDIGLQEMLFHYGKYLLLASSRENSLPANLQGIWCEHVDPIWGSKYTININTQMNYWMSNPCDLSSLEEPLFELLEKAEIRGRNTAEKMYGCRGSVLHHNIDMYGDSDPQSNTLTSSIWPMGGAWLSLHIFEHYEYTQELPFLQKYYPLMKSFGEFYIDYLIEDKEGYLVTCPSISPENTYILKNGVQGHACCGPSMDNQILFILFTYLIKAGTLLQEDSHILSTWENLRQRLHAPAIDSDGRLMEWSTKVFEVEPGHRHISHLFGLHPGNIITESKTPNLFAAARKTLEYRLANGGGHTGWSQAWIVNFWARLQDGEQAYLGINKLLVNSTLTNLLNTHPPFQIDGNFGIANAMIEMLYQSHEEYLYILPALPKQWKDGRISGMIARGGYSICMEWKDGKILDLEIKHREKRHVYIRIDKEHMYHNEQVLQYVSTGKIIEKGEKYGL